MLLNHLSDGWYSYYTVALPRQHELLPAYYLAYWSEDLLPRLAPMVILSAFFVVHEIVRGDRSRGVLYLALWLGGIGSSWISRMHSGGWLNVLIPAHALLALVAALGMGLAARRDFEKWTKGVRVAAGLLALVQFGLLVYNPARYAPTARDLQAGRHFVHILASLPGEVCVPCHGYLPTRAGKRTFADWQAVYDVLRAKAGGCASDLDGELMEAYAAP